MITEYWKDQGINLPEDHAQFVKKSTFISATQLAVERVDDPELALKFGRTFSVIQLGPLGAAMMSSATAFEALYLTSKFRNGFLPHELEIHEQENVLKVSPVIETTQSAYAKFDLLVLSMGVIETLSELLDYLPSGISIDFPFPKPDGEVLQIYQQYLPVEMVFDQDFASLYIPKSVLDEPLTTRDEVSRNSFIEACRNTQQSLQREEGLLAKIYDFLDAGNISPSIEQLAEALDVPIRTLRYQLKKEGKNFRKILGDYRLQKAIELLENSDLPIKSISYQLGYQNVPSFYRTFKKEMGITPIEYRREKNK